MVQAALLYAAGTNCDQEMAQAFELAGARVSYVHINQAKRNPRLLRRYAILGLPGGFTYGDYIAAGRILANELRFRLSEEIARFIEEGKLILGVCNGFQVLVKAGVLPGLEGCFGRQTVTLMANDSQRFEDRWVHLEPSSPRCVFTQGMTGPVELPVAHAEGKFVTDSRATLETLFARELVAMRYVHPKGGQAVYPWNPNGSVADIAGLCDPTGRVFGLMPHPERFCRVTQHPRWTRQTSGSAIPDGLKIFQNAVNYAKKNL